MIAGNGSALDMVHPEAPCCGACTIRLKDLNLFYWPDQATVDFTSAVNSIVHTASIISDAHPQVPNSYVDEEGFTL